MLGAHLPWLSHALDAVPAVERAVAARSDRCEHTRQAIAPLASEYVSATAAAAQVLVGAEVCAKALSQLSGEGHAEAMATLEPAAPVLGLLVQATDAVPELGVLRGALSRVEVCVEDIATAYEAVLAAHHGGERRRLGVFHTPTEVARYVVDAVDRSLEQLGFEGGLTDARTYAQCRLTAPAGLPTTAPAVRIVDPAVGAGVFLREVLRAAHRRGGAMAPSLCGLLSGRLLGYDVLPAALSLCRLHLAVVLAELGHAPHLASGLVLHRASFLAHVAGSAAELRGVNVVLGNPPYARGSQNRSPAVTAMLGGYKRGLDDERNLQPLSDDYIKFVRAAELLMQGVPKGVVGLVTNHTFIRGRLHRTMRRSLRQTFSFIDILDLHGSSKVRVHSERDENVFAIAQGVAATTFVRDLAADGTVVRYGELVGKKRDKLARLASGAYTSPVELPRQPLEAFAPVEAVPHEYECFAPLSELFAFHSVGGKPGDDSVLVGFDADELLSKLRTTSAALDGGHAPRTEAARKLAARPADKPFSRDSVIPYAYRPFDERLAYYEPAIWTRPLKSLHQYVDGEPFLLTTRTLKDHRFAHVFATRRFPDVIALSTTSSVNCYAFPLRQIRPQVLERACGLILSPEEVFAYVYATLHSPTYRERYLGGLRYDFPRVPLGREPGLVAALVARGGRLLRSHLGEGEPKGRRPRFVDGGDRSVRSASLEEVAHGVGGGGAPTVKVNDVSRFVNLPRDCWDFRVGGYQVCRKWLADRRRVGRRLSDRDVDHYCDMVARIDETLRVQQEIDEAIQAFGGWPEAFV